jgi:nucleolin
VKPRKSFGGDGEQQVSEPSATLFVKNLSFNADENSVWAIFADAQSVRIVTDRETGNSRG